MLSQSKIAKLTAKSVFKGREIKMLAIGSILTFSLLMLYPFYLLSASFFSFPVVAAFLAAFCLLWEVPLFLGATRMLWQELADGRGEIADIFYYFSSFRLYARALKFICIFIFRVSVIFVICLAPATTISVITDIGVQNAIGFTLPIWLSGLHILGSLFSFVGSIIAFIISLKFFAAPFLFVSDEDSMIFGLFYKATRLSKMGYLEFLSLVGSFVGWFFLSLLVFFLPFVLPYFLTSAVSLCRFMVYQYNKKLSSEL